MRFSGGGCQPCKTRRKKCDETKPVCQRCAKARRVCFGYESAFTVVHNENEFASGQLKRPRGPRSSKVDPSEVTCLVPSRDLQTEAVNYYIRQHLEPVKYASALMDSPREPLLSLWNSDPLLDSAVLSIAMALFSRTKQSESAKIQSSIHYRESLHSLQGALRDLRKENIDACLLAICLLSRYEDAIFAIRVQSQIAIGKMLKSRSHHDGAIAVLKFWMHTADPKETPSSTVKYARRVVRKSALLRMIELPEWLRDGGLFGEQGYEEALDKIVIRIIRLRSVLSTFTSQLVELKAANEIAKPVLETALDEAREIEIALQDWVERFPGKELRTCHKFANSNGYPNASFYHSSTFNYRNFSDAAICAQYYGYIILVKTIEMRILEAGGLEIAHQAQDMRKIADELSMTIPYCLERLNVGPNGPELVDRETQHDMAETRKPYVADLVVLPLIVTTSSASDYLDQNLCQWFRLQLADVGRLLGYGVLELAGAIDLVKL